MDTGKCRKFPDTTVVENDEDAVEKRCLGDGRESTARASLLRRAQHSRTARSGERRTAAIGDEEYVQAGEWRTTILTGVADASPDPQACQHLRRQGHRRAAIGPDHDAQAAGSYAHQRRQAFRHGCSIGNRSRRRATSR